EAVAAAEETVLRAVENDEGPHAVEALDEAVAPLAVAVEEDLGVGMVGDESATMHLQLRAEVGVVVDFAVEDDADLAVGGPHGLRAAAEVDDGEAAVAEEDGGTFGEPVTFGVGSAVADGVGHALEDVPVTGTGEASYPAHGI